MKFFLGLLLCALSIGAAQQIGSEVPNFAMLDYKGRYHELRRADAKVVVLFFTSDGCPIARQSISRLKQIQKQFGPEGVLVWMVDSNTGDDRESIRREAQEFNFGHLPVLIDDSQGVAAMLGVKRTGTVKCIETKHWTVIYEGAIDDQMVEGAQKPEPTEHYLQTALKQYLAGQSVKNPSTSARGCVITFDGKESVSYSKQVAPILESKCYGCHSSGHIGSWSMSSYKKVKGMSDMMQEVLLAQRMPPWHADPQYGHFQDDASLTLDQKKTLLRWIEQGAERGDGEDPLAAAVSTNVDWSLGKPDAIVKLPEVQEIPANGILDYRHIKVEAPFDHDVWIKGIVVKPDNHRVVHHIIVRARDKGQTQDNPNDAFLIGWAPGSPEMFYPEGTGKLIKKGSVLDFEMHYTTSGREEKDQSEIGIYLLPEKPRMVLKTHAAYNFDFEIDPHESSENTFATYVFKKDSLLFDLSPHMHLRGSWMKMEALYPNGHREVLLSVPHYDFNWQRNYRLKEPKRMPAGTWILCSGGFDNSARNPNNPNPDIKVQWGDQSFDEMFIGFMGVAEIPPEPKLSAKE
jgi:peroxiredoxin